MKVKPKRQYTDCDTQPHAHLQLLPFRSDFGQRVHLYGSASIRIEFEELAQQNRLRLSLGYCT
jgi:hypothetical protein